MESIFIDYFCTIVDYSTFGVLLPAMLNQRIQHIDAWRLIAISLVIFSHIIEFSHPIYGDAAPWLVWRARPLGKFGVQLFFCISGFVICRGMMREAGDRGALDLRGFYVRRAFRILPPLLLYGAFVAVLAWTGILPVSVQQFGQTAAFLCNIYSLGNCGWYLGQTWSLAYEEQFYLVYPLLFMSMALSRHRIRAIVIVLASIALASGLRIKHFDEAGNYVSTFLYMAGGCLSALYYDKLAPLLRRLPIYAWFMVSLAMIVANAIVLPKILLDYAYPVLMPIAICIAAFGTPMHHPVVHALFGNRPLCYLGKISYTVYLWQQLATAPHAFASPWTSIGLVIIVFWWAHVSFKYFEYPLMRAGASIAARRLEETNRAASMAG